MAYEDFVTRMTAEGLTTTDQYSNGAKEYINEKFADSPFYRLIPIEGVSTDVRMVTTDKFNIRTLLFKPDTVISIGSYVTIGAQKWIVMDFFENDIYPKSTIQLSNSVLKWLDSDGLLRQYPCVFESPSRTQTGVKIDNTMILQDGKRRITVKKDSNTTLIPSSKRFLFDSKAYMVTDVDPTTNIGLTTLVVLETQIDTARDNLELGIADYVGNVANYTVSITNGHSFTIQENQTIQFNAEVKNNGTVVTKPVVWSVSDTSVATIDTTGLLTAVVHGGVTVTAKLAIDQTILDTATVTVEVVPPADVYTMNITTASTAPDEIKTDQSKVYSIVVYLNGTVTNETVTWQLFSDDQSSATTLASITSSNGTSCTLKNNGVYSGFIQLKATLVRDTSILSWKRIQMRPLL